MSPPSAVAMRAALEAYSEAARLAPDRALPLVGVGAVLRRLGKTTEALAAYDAALDRAPTDDESPCVAGPSSPPSRRPGRRGRRTRPPGRRARCPRPPARGGRCRAPGPRVGRIARAAGTTLRRLRRPAGRGRRRRGRGRGPRAGRATALEAARSTPTWPPEPPPEPPIDPIAATRRPGRRGRRRRRRPGRPISPSASRPRQRGAEHASAAIDACYLALAVAPADPGLHLTLAEHLPRSWLAGAGRRQARPAGRAGQPDRRPRDPRPGRAPSSGSASPTSRGCALAAPEPHRATGPARASDAATTPASTPGPDVHSANDAGVPRLDAGAGPI